MKTIQFQTLQILLGRFNLLEMKTTKHLLTNYSLIFLLIYNGSYYKRNL